MPPRTRRDRVDTCAGGRSDRLPISRRSGVFSEQWALAPSAISLGLAPRHPTEADRVPLRARVEELISDGMLPEDCVYVGQGHHSHRLKRTKWASPFTPGQDVPLDEWLRRYVQWVMETLSHCLHELQGVTLVCDCQHGGPCEADMLAGMVFDVRPQAPAPLDRAVLTARSAKPQRQVRLLRQRDHSMFPQAC